jgi:hypothetical protein
MVAFAPSLRTLLLRTPSSCVPENRADHANITAIFTGEWAIIKADDVRNAHG